MAAVMIKVRKNNVGSQCMNEPRGPTLKVFIDVIQNL